MQIVISSVWLSRLQLSANCHNYEKSTSTWNRTVPEHKRSLMISRWFSWYINELNLDAKTFLIIPRMTKATTLKSPVTRDWVSINYMLASITEAEWPRKAAQSLNYFSMYIKLVKVLVPEKLERRRSKIELEILINSTATFSLLFIVWHFIFTAFN